MYPFMISWFSVLLSQWELMFLRYAIQNENSTYVLYLDVPEPPSFSSKAPSMSSHE